jgi:Glutathione S-transferase, N-terminal domain
MRSRRCRRQSRLRQRRKLDRLFSVEISALRACSETESKRKSEQPFHFCPPRRAEPACILPQHALNTGGKRNGLKRRVADLLISEGDGTKRPFLGHKRHSEREENMDTPLLWHIPLSHYSEKVRWALDYEGIAHRRRVLGPDYLIRVWRATGQGKLPVLWLDG